MDYIVQPGDSLYTIGLRFGVDPGYIARFNNLTCNQIFIGQCLRIPVGTDPLVLSDIYDRLDNLDDRVKCLEETNRQCPRQFPRTYTGPYARDKH